MTNREYHQSDGISRSRLFNLLKSPEYFKYCMEYPPTETPDMAFGSAFHKLVLQPDGFADEFAVAPDVDRRTRDGREEYAAFSKLADGKTIISADVYSVIQIMRDKLLSNQLASAFLSGDTEQVYYWNDKATGELCKCRADALYYTGDNVIVDLKTCRNAETEAFENSSLRLGYDIQAAMYKDGIDSVTGKSHEFVFIAIEKDEPYSINILQADTFFLEYGTHRYRKLLELYHKCRESGNWYGYLGEYNIIQTLSVPAWLLRQMT